MQNYYHTLGVNSDATQQQIRQAYLQLCKQYHPDKNSGADWAEERLKLINEAYETISDPMRRLQFDKQRRQLKADKAAQVQARQAHIKTTAPRVDLTDVVEKSSILVKPLIMLTLAIVFFIVAILSFEPKPKTVEIKQIPSTSYSTQAYESERSRFMNFCKKNPRILTRKEFDILLEQPIEPGFTYLLNRLLVQGDTSDIHYLIESRYRERLK